MKNMRALFCLVCVLQAAVCLCASQPPELSGEETWGYRRALPAVVNPVVSSPMQEVISLRGEWELHVTPRVYQWRHPKRNIRGKPWPGSRSIQVPGCWEAQGVGEPGTSVTWDCKWDHAPREIRNVFMGEVWYRKSVDIPEEWQNRRIWLKIGGVRSQGWFWVNDQRVAWVNDYCGTYKYDITDLVQPGQCATVVAAVNNDVPSRKGQMVSSHCFGGIYRDIEIEATPNTRIDDAWVRGDFDKRQAEVHATVAFATAAGKLTNPVLRVKVMAAGRDVSRKDAKTQIVGANNHSPNHSSNHSPIVFTEGKQKTEVVVRVSLDPFRAWTPEHPHLYVAELTLCDGDTPVHGWTERFGVRKIEVRGDRFFLNNKPFFIRGFGDDFVYPLTMVSPASKDEHLKHLRTAKAAGFNYVRLHTHCELPEYFEAADEVGIMIQPELPYYGDYPGEAFTFDPLRDLKELYQHYRRYVSLTTYCGGNEGLLGHPLDEDLYKLAKRLDPDRLVLHQDGRYNTAKNSDFLGGPAREWQPGSFECELPFVAHEYLNLSVKQDPRLADRFSGAWMPPITLEHWDEFLQAAGLDRRWGEALQDSQHALQKVYQKRGIEAARLDPACDGYSFWTIVDVVVQQGDWYSAQGLFTPFWEPKKRGATPDDFRIFNGPSTLLLKTETENRVAVSGDKVQADFWIAHYGDEPVVNARGNWKLQAEGQTLVQGEFECGDIALGSTRLLAETDITIPHVAKPMAAVLAVSVGDISNSWDMWLFPRREIQDGNGIAVSRDLLPALEKLYSNLIPAESPAAAQADLLISSIGSPESDAALAAGKRVLLMQGMQGRPNVSLGWWRMRGQVGTAFAHHPALGEFPHDGTLSPLAFRLVKDSGKRLPVEGLLPDDMLVVGEGGKGYFLYASAVRMGRGQALLTFGLDLTSGTPEGTCLLDGFIRYARSDAFNPQSVIKPVKSYGNGWLRTLRAGETTYDAYAMGSVRIDAARAMAGMNELVWQTQPVPAEAATKPEYQVKWLGGMGYFTQPAGSFELFVNDRKVLDIPNITPKDAEWKSTDGKVRLEYQHDSAIAEEGGRLTLTLPSTLITPGQPLTLKIVGSESKSRRWIGIFHQTL